MAGEIKKALEEATEKADKNQESPELSSRVKKLLARKKRLQRKNRQKIPGFAPVTAPFLPLYSKYKHL